MKYDFTTVVNRAEQGSTKWSELVRDGARPEQLVPFSVADMELKHPPELVQGLQQYTEQMIFGYTQATDAYYESVQDWMERRHGFRPPREWFVEFPGVVPALREMVRVFTRPEDSVLILTPVYYPFRAVVRGNHRTLVESELIDTGTSYDIDFADVERKLAQPEVTLMILCSPHNPVGRVWSRAELVRLCELCKKHEVFLLADEIHFDLILPGYQHTSVATLTEYLDNMAICTAPSKTFNLAGLQTSNIFIPNEQKRQLLCENRGFFTLNAYGYKACELVYTRCGDWLQQLLQLIDRNRKLTEEYFASCLPEIKAYELQGTYLQWLDFRALGMEPKQLKHFMRRQAGWYCDEGYIFGMGGAGFERLNLACPTWVLEQALERLQKAVQSGRTDV